MTEETILETRPLMFRGNPSAFVFSLLLIPLGGLGLILLLVWRNRARKTRIRITSEKVELVRGSDTESVALADIADVVVAETLCNRKLSAGSVVIRRPGGELTLPDIPDPHAVADTLETLRKQAKEARHKAAPAAS